jgi:hypothetical protein
MKGLGGDVPPQVESSRLCGKARLSKNTLSFELRVKSTTHTRRYFKAPCQPLARPRILQRNIAWSKGTSLVFCVLFVEIYLIPVL